VTALGLTIALLGVGLVATAGTAVAGGDDVVTQQEYVAGLSTRQDLPVQQWTNACTDEANVGGLCEEPVPTETNLVVLVDDRALDRVPFHWQALNADGEMANCPHGHSVGEDPLSLPPGCPNVDVYVNAPATQGQITIKHGDVVIL
jgi:hypothetical protein